MSTKRRVLTIRTDSGSIKIPARLTSEEWALFEELARREGRSVTGQISWLLRQRLAARAPETGFHGLEIAPVARVRKAREAADDRESRSYWRARSAEERLAEVERLRELAYSLQTGGNGLPGIVFEGAVVRGAP